MSPGFACASSRTLGPRLGNLPTGSQTNSLAAAGWLTLSTGPSKSHSSYDGTVTCQMTSASAGPSCSGQRTQTSSACSYPMERPCCEVSKQKRCSGSGTSGDYHGRFLRESTRSCRDAPSQTAFRRASTELGVSRSERASPHCSERYSLHLRRSHRAG